MGSFQIKIIIGTIQIGGHGTDKIGTILAVIRLAHFDTGNFGNRIRFIGGFQFPGEQILFFYRLRGKFGINTGTPQKQQFLNPMEIALMNHIGLNGEIIVDEFGRVGIICPNAPDFCCGQKYIFRLFSIKKSRHRILIP